MVLIPHISVHLSETLHRPLIKSHMRRSDYWEERIASKQLWRVNVGEVVVVCRQPSIKIVRTRLIIVTCNFIVRTTLSTFYLKYFASHFLCRQKFLLVDLQHALVGDHDHLTILLLVFLPQVAGHWALKKHSLSFCQPQLTIITLPPLSQILHPMHQYFSYRFPGKLTTLILNRPWRNL